LKNTKASRVGIAYSFQVSSEELPSQEWDERVEWIITDAYVLHVERKDQRQWKR
jgi:5-formyltetrahydrofolate cyclo-ligase